MSGHDIVEILRMTAVIALVCIAGALATPRGRLPLALRGLAKILHRDAGTDGTNGTSGTEGTVPFWKRLLAFGLVLVAVALALSTL